MLYVLRRNRYPQHCKAWVEKPALLFASTGWDDNIYEHVSNGLMPVFQAAVATGLFQLGEPHRVSCQVSATCFAWLALILLCCSSLSGKRCSICKDPHEFRARKEDMYSSQWVESSNFPQISASQKVMCRSLTLSRSFCQKSLLHLYCWVGDPNPTFAPGQTCGTTFPLKSGCCGQISQGERPLAMHSLPSFLSYPCRATG